MNYPRTHIFVDAMCPMLFDGRLNDLAHPGKLISILSPRQSYASHDDATEMRAIRDCRSAYEQGTLEVHLIVEGSLSPLLLLSLNPHIKDIISIRDKAASELASRVRSAIDQLFNVKRLYDDLSDANDELFSQLHDLEERLSTDIDTCADALPFITDEWVSNIRIAVTNVSDAFVKSTKNSRLEMPADQARKAA